MDTAREYNTTTQHGPDTTDPAAIDWPERQARAVVPFDVVNGLPINPLTTDLPEGRGGLWHWGEAVAADALVFGRPARAGRLHVLMIERGDGHGWALPGGMLDPGETPRQAVARELAEETGLALDPWLFTALSGRGVPDPRAGLNAWMVTVPSVAVLRDGPLPTVQGLDDAADAAWFPATWTAVNDATGGHVFPAHVALLRAVLAS